MMRMKTLVFPLLKLEYKQSAGDGGQGGMRSGTMAPSCHWRGKIAKAERILKQKNTRLEELRHIKKKQLGCSSSEVAVKREVR